MDEDKINDIVYALNNEEVEYNKYQILEQLRRMADACPRESVDAVPVVVEELNDSLRKLDGDDISDNKKVRLGTSILESIIEGTDPVEDRLRIGRADVDAFLERGGSDHRALGYRLLGRSATPEEVGKLIEDISHEVDSVVESRDSALKDARTIVLDALEGGGELTPSEAVTSFSELYAADRIEPDSETLERVRNLLVESIHATSGDRERTFDAVERIVRRDDDIGAFLAGEAFELLEGDAGDRSVGWRTLSRIAEGSPHAVFGRADRLIEEIASDDSESTLEALEIVATAGTHRTSVPVDVAEAVVRALEEDNRDVVLAAIEAVAAVGFYPPPDQLRELAEGGGKVADAASEAIDDLSKGSSRRSPHFVELLRESDPEVGIFEGDEGDYYLKRRTEDGIWTDVDVGALRRGAVEETVTAVNRDENAPVVFPYYDPRDAVLLAVALVLSDLGADRQIGLFSPGSQAHWGMKGEIRDELERFAISDVSGDVVDAKPLPDAVPHAYVWDGEMKDDSEGDGPGRFVLCKKLHDLEHVDHLNVVLSNLTSRTREDTQERLRDVEEKHPDATAVNAYSYYVKNERDGRPRYGPPLGLDSASTVPSFETIDAVLEGHDFDWKSHLSAPSKSSDTAEISNGIRGEWSLGDDDVRSLAHPASIRIEHVEGGDVSALLDQIFEESASLRGVDDGGAGGMIFSRQLFFERLPVPVRDFDEWIRDRYYDGERFLPPLVEERIDDVERRAGSVENLQAVRPLNRSVEIFRKISDRLHEENPLFDALKEHVREARANDRRLAILSETPKHAEILRYSLTKHDVVSWNELDSGSISVVSPDEARELGVHDVLVVSGALHRENAGFYVHPRVAETVVLTYDRTWATMVERHAREFVDTLNGVVAGADYSPYPYPELSGDTEPESVDETVDEAPASDASLERPDTHSTESSGSTSASAKSKAEVLADAVESVSAREYREESGRYERKIRHFVVKTENGETIELTNRNRILRRRTSGGSVEYHWVSPEPLASGDTIVTIPEEVRTEIWEEQLQHLYEDEISADHAIDRLGDWYESVEEIWKQVAEELSVDRVATDARVRETIYNRVNRSNDDFDRTRATVRTWFESVLEADSPIDLVEDPSLTIGPRSYLDIAAVGRVFEHDRLVTGAKEIEAAMEGLRTINRQQGHELYDTIREQMNSSRSTRVSEAAKHHTVDGVTEVEDEADSE
jgi:hypothetical protein